MRTRDTDLEVTGATNRKAPEEIVRETNREYAQLLRETYERCPILDPDPGEDVTAHKHRLAEECGRTGGVVVPYQRHLVTSVQHKVLSIAEGFMSFWRGAKPVYVPALRELKGTRLFECGEITFGHLCYFDTLVFLDPVVRHVQRWSVSQDAFDLSFNVCSSLVDHRPLLELLEADSDYPLIAIYPYVGSRDFGDAVDDLEGQSGDPVAIRADTLTAAFFRDVSRPGSDDCMEWMGKPWLYDGCKAETVEFARLFDVERVRNIFGGVGGAAQEESSSAGPADQEPTREDRWDALMGRGGTMPGKAFDSVHLIIYGIFCDLAFQEIVSLGADADPLTSWMNAYSWKLESDVSGIARESQSGEEAFAARCLQMPPFRSLDGLGVDDLVQFREGGGVGVMRSTFREQRRRVKSANRDDLASILDGMVESVTDAIDEHNAEVLSLEREIREKRKRLRRRASFVAGSVALNLATLPFPWLSAVLLPASVTVGGPSLLELVRDGRSIACLEEELTAMGCRPMGILAKAFASPGEQFPESTPCA